MNRIFRKKDVASILESNKNASLHKSMGAIDVTLMSIGAVIGTGVMVLTGLVAAQDSGPAVILSFLISAIACILVALCYAEFASSIPTSGSAYAYVYVSMGEILAHLVGWTLILGYVVSVATVAGGWASYFNTLLREMGIILPNAYTAIPELGGVVNLPAVFIVFVVAFIVSRGTSESKRINNFMVIVKLFVIGLFIVVGVFHMDFNNLTPFMPFGWKGVFAGAASVFFAFTGFDAVSTCAEEVRDVQKNLPIGIIASIAICTSIYVAVCLVLTSVCSYTELNVPDAMAYALDKINQNWAASLLAVGAVIGITAVMFAYCFGASRIIFSMSRDGLLPEKLSKIHEKSKAPRVSTFLVGICAACLAGFVHLKELANLANITLIGAFLLVCISVILFRKSHPDIKRSFKVPLVPFLPILAVACCLFLMFNLPLSTWIYYVSWAVLGVIVYFVYSKKHSKLQAIHNKLEN